MAKYKVLAQSFINNKIVEVGEVVDYDGRPGANLELIELVEVDAQPDSNLEPIEPKKMAHTGRVKTKQE
jgi:hypothetical protein